MDVSNTIASIISCVSIVSMISGWVGLAAYPPGRDGHHHLSHHVRGAGGETAGTVVKRGVGVVHGKNV